MTSLNHKSILLSAILATLGADPAAASSVLGPLANFDVVNDTGVTTHGFEIEIEDSRFDHTLITSTFGGAGRGWPADVVRYGAPVITDIPGFGVKISYMATFNNGTWSTGTETGLYTPQSDSCWSLGGIGYPNVPCDHFGVSTLGQPAKVNYRWLVEDAANLGTLKPFATNVALPVPNWVITPPAQAGGQPMVRAEFEIPNPEGDLYGQPYWVKIFKTENAGPLEIENLVIGNLLIQNADTEIEWELLQARPGQDNIVFNEAEVGIGNENGAVVRHYEFYKYNLEGGRTHFFDDNGTLVPYVDSVNGEVMACFNDGCNNPTDWELGTYVGAQIAGVNLNVAAVPEPGKFAMLLAGLGFVAVAVRRRRR